MNAIEIISQDLFDKVRSRYSNLEMGDETGNVTSDPREARFFDFDYTIEGNNLGRVSISINERGSLKMFYGQGILENADPISQNMWFDFLREMRNFAKRRLLRFDTRDITKSNLDKTDFQYLASVGTKEDTMSESKMFGSSKSSYLPLEKTRLIIRHSKAVDENQRGARSRNINSIYIENEEGERFKYPFIHKAGALAMQRHVANGGRPYDDCGKAIIKMSEQIAQLAAFKKHVGKHDSMHADANEITERACMKLDGLRNHIGSLSKQHHYDTWKETIAPGSQDEQAVLDQATMENYKSKFTVSTFAEDLSQYFPLIHSIMKEAGDVDLDEYVGEAHGDDHDVCPECHEDPCVCNNEKTVKEFREFEAWANAIVEGTMGDDMIAALKDLLSNESLTLGVDGVSAIEALEGIGITDDQLNAALHQLSKLNPEADPTPTIGAWLAKEDPEAAKALGMENTPSQKVPSEPPAPEGGEMEPVAPEGEEQPTDEEMESEMEQPEASIREVAEMVKSFYDRETGKFPLGETGVVTKIRKEMGDRAGMLAEKLIQSLIASHPSSGEASAVISHSTSEPVHQNVTTDESPAKDKQFYLKIDGNICRKDGVPIKFNSKDHARTAGQHYAKKNPGKKVTITSNPHSSMNESSKVNELSNEKLGKYKVAAGADASKADKEGNTAKGNKRFKGIVKATNKQFDNDAKKVKESIDDTTFNAIMKLAGLKK